MDKLQELAKECELAGASSAKAVGVDVLDLKSHGGLDKALSAALGGPVDVLVNNAGRSQRSLAEDTDLEVTRDMMELNVIGNISVTKAVLPGMLARRSGHIVVTSSVAGKVGAPVSSSYAATKHAVQGYYGALRNEVAYRGVDVTLVCPGPVESDITQHGEAAARTAPPARPACPHARHWRSVSAQSQPPGPTAAFTAEHGVKASDASFAPDKSRRMTAERCAELMARSIHHSKLYEIWVSPQPILLFTMMNQLAPTLAAWVGSTRVGPARVEALRSGKPGYEAVQGLGVMFGSAAKPKAE